MRILLGLGVILALVGAYFAGDRVGYTRGEGISRVEIAKYQGNLQKLRADLATAQARVDVQTVTEYVTRTQRETQVEYRNRDVIRTAIVDRPVEQNVSEGFVYAYNQSVIGADIDFNLANVPRASRLPDSVLLQTLNENNAIARRNAERLRSLQTWVRRTNETQREVTGDRPANSTGSVRETRPARSDRGVSNATSGTDDTTRRTETTTGESTSR